jgi:hypothetical protein
MKRQFNKFLLLVMVLGFTIKAGASDRWETLRAINWVENPTNQTGAGRFGELGPYQFRSGTWRMHTSKPFSQANQREAADEVAVKHYEWIKRTLERAGAETSAFNIAMAWNCGVDTVLSGRAPSVSFRYAERVTNLVEKLKERAQSLVEETPRPVAPQPQRVEDQSGNELRFRVLQDTPRFVIAAG